MLLISLCHPVTWGSLGVFGGDRCCSDYDVELVADLVSPLLNFSHTAHCCVLWAVFGEEGPCGTVVCNCDTYAVSLVHISRLYPVGQHRPSLVFAGLVELSLHEQILIAPSFPNLPIPIILLGIEWRTPMTRIASILVMI